LARKAQLLLDGEVLRRERLVDLEEVDLRGLEPGPVERLANRRRRPDAHDAGIASGDAPVEETRQWLEAAPLGGLAPRGEERRRTVADSRRVAGGDHAIFHEHRGELGQSLDRGLGARVLVALEALRSLLALELERDDLGLELPGRVGLGPSLLRAERVRVGR